MNNKLQTYFFFALLILIGILAFFIVRPYLSALVLAIALTVIVQPLHRRFASQMPKHPSLTALISTVIVTALIIGPFSFLGFQVFVEAREFYLSVTTSDQQLRGTINFAQKTISNLFPYSPINVNQYLQQVAGWMAQNIGSVFTGIGQGFLTFVLSLAGLFFFLRDGEKIKEFLFKLSPLADKYDEVIVAKTGQAINSVIRGTLIIAFIQGLLTGLGFALFGVPNAALWGSIAVIAALVPSVGTSLVIIPGVLFLFFTKASLLPAVGLLAWGALAVGLIDNFLGPKLVGRAARVHPLLILLSVLGGINLFGPIGFIVGPLVASLLIALVNLYPEVIKDGKG